MARRGEEKGAGKGSYVSIPGRFSSVSTRDFRCSVDELSRSMEPEIGVTCDESQGGCGCRGGCLLTLRGHRYCFGGLRAEYVGGATD